MTTGGVGLEFKPTAQAGTTTYALAGPRSVFFAMSSTPAGEQLVLLTDDEPLLLALLRNQAKVAVRDAADVAALASGTSIAVFNHATQRAPYLRLSSLIDSTSSNARSSSGSFAPGQREGGDVSSAPPFFSRNIGSLSDSFQALQTERMVERRADANLRQTVTYTWQNP